MTLNGLRVSIGVEALIGSHALCDLCMSESACHSIKPSPALPHFVNRSIYAFRF